MGPSPWGHKELDTTKRLLSFSLSLSLSLFLSLSLSFFHQHGQGSPPGTLSELGQREESETQD